MIQINETVPEPASQTVLLTVFVAEEWRVKLVIKTMKRGEESPVFFFFVFVGGGEGAVPSCQPPRRFPARGGALLTAPCV